MTITQAELGQRLRSARDTAGLTQQQVADSLNLARPAIAQIESGNRAISSLELEQMCRLYRRHMADLFADSFEEDPTNVLLRALEGPEFFDGGLNRQALLQCAKLCREITSLEEQLELPVSPIVPVSYILPPPSNRWEAVRQGIYLADQERKRLSLGVWPVVDFPELIKRQGVRVAEHRMLDNISGLFFHGKTVGLVMVVNSENVRTRRLFTYAHEYCHVLADRNRASLISHTNNRDELIEVRANAFAPHFLMPDGGVREFLHTLGKAEQMRQVVEIFDGVEEVSAQRRTSAKSQSIEAHHMVSLAYHFGMSYEATLYQLLNLKLITKDRLDELRAASARVPFIESVLKFRPPKQRLETDSLTEQLMELALEAYERDIISKKKLFELAKDAGLSRQDLQQAISHELDDAVGAIIPG